LHNGSSTSKTSGTNSKRSKAVGSEEKERVEHDFPKPGGIRTVTQEEWDNLTAEEAEKWTEEKQTS